MLLATVKDEFVFYCQSRNLSPKTTKNYGRQIEYLFNYLAQEYQITHIEDVKPEYIKAFLLKMKPNHTPNYLNDLLKAYKVFFRYAFNEGYTDTLITAKIHNVKAPKVIIRTFTEAELKKMANYYTGYEYLQIRNKVIMLLLIDTGIRMNELIGFPWGRLIVHVPMQKKSSVIVVLPSPCVKWRLNSWHLLMIFRGKSAVEYLYQTFLRQRLC